MKHVAVCLCAVVLTFLSTARPASAQPWGWMFDKIQDWSGPSMQYWGLTLRMGYQPGQRPDSLTVASLDSCFTGAAGRAVPATAQTYFDSIKDTLWKDSVHFDEAVVDRLRRGASTLGSRTVGGTQTCMSMMSSLLLPTPPEIDPYHGFVWRLGVFLGSDRNNRDRAEDIYGLLIQPSLEYRTRASRVPVIQLLPYDRFDIGIEAGMSMHYLHGDITPFWKLTHPIVLNVHPFPRCEGWLLRNLRGGVGVHYVPEFEGDAFAPVPYVVPEGAEWSPVWFVAIDLSLSAKPDWVFWRGCFG